LSPQGTLQGIALFTPPFPDGGVQQRFWNSLLQTIGSERAQAFWQASEDILREALNGFGEAPRRTSVYLSGAGVITEVIYYNADGSMRRTHFYDANSTKAPEALKGYIETLKTTASQQARNTP
jgi:hypothetical protein